MERQFTKRFVSLFLSLCMIMSVCSAAMPVISSAEPAPDVIYGKYDENGNFVQTDASVLNYTSENGTQLSLYKLAEATANKNEYEITLKVEALTSAEVNPLATAVVLVVDVSGSMDDCSMCKSSEGVFVTRHEDDCIYNTNDGFLGTNSKVTSEQSRLTAVKKELTNFLTKYAGTVSTEGTGRLVSIVKYEDEATIVQDWIDVSKSGNLAAVETVINNLSADGGTNFDDGFRKANELLEEATVKYVDEGRKFCVALTDGMPTYYIDSDGDVSGSGQSGSKTYNDAAAASAADVKENALLYAVGYGDTTEQCYSNGPTVSEFLSQSIATSSDTAYDAKDANELTTVYDKISDHIIEVANTGKSFTVKDPMSDFSTIVTANYPAVVSDALTIEWHLESVEPVTSSEGNITYYKYTYTYSYTVNIPDTTGLNETDYYPLNGRTLLTWTSGENFDFPIPAARIKLDTKKITFDPGDHGKLDGEDEFEIKEGEDEPTPPNVIPDEDYYFTEWKKEENPDTGDITYTAQYELKTNASLTVADTTVKYNGTLQKGSATVTESPLMEGHSWVYSYTAASGTDAGTYTNSAFANVDIVDSNGNSVAGMYKITSSAAKLVIEKRNVTLTSADASKTYDTTTLSATDVTVSGDGWASGEGAAYTYTGKQTSVGSSANSFTYTLFSNTKASNYNITKKEGTLTVTAVDEVTVYITGKTLEVNYNGSEQSVTGYEVVIDNPLYKESDFSFSGTATAKGTVKGTYAMGLTASMFTNNAASTFKKVNFVVTDGSLVIKAASVKLVITAASASKTYDGTALTAPTFTFNNAALLGGDTLTATVAGTVTDAGSVNNTVSSYKITGADQSDRTACYDIQTVAGKLTVDKRSVVLTSASDQKEFDGKALKNSNVVIGGDKFAEGEGASIVVTGSQTYVGSSKNTFTYTLNAGTKAANYTIKKTEGTLTVKTKSDKIVLAVEPNANTADLTYNGQKQTVEGFKQLVFTVEGQNYTVSGITATASGTAAGTYDVTVSGTPVVKDANGVDVTDNFTVSITPGVLTIKKYTVNASSSNLSKEYDGKPLTDTGSITHDALISGDTITFTHTGSQTAVGQSDNSFTYTITSPNGDGNYDVKTTYGKLTVTPVENVTVYISGKNSTVNYNGSEQSVSGYDVSFSNQLYTANDFTFSGTAVAKGTVTGTYNMGLTAAMFANKSATTFSNVTFVVTDGSLTINKASLKLTITAGSISKKYDGTAITLSSYGYTPGALLGGDKLTATVAGTITDAGSVSNTVTSYKITAADQSDRTACYNIETVAGKLTVTKREITFTSASDSKKFDGYPLTNSTVAVGLDGFAGSEGADFTVTGSQTYTGSSKNSFTYTLKNGAKESNYSIKKVEGTLTVNPATEKPVLTLEPNANSADLTYNGKKQTVDGFKQLVFTVEGNTYTVSGVTATASGTAAGTYDITVTGTPVVRDANGVDVTENFTVSIDSGVLTIKKYAITATSGNFTKEYDGTALLNSDYATYDALISGDTIDFTFTGSQTAVGQSDNSFTYTITSPNGDDNYEVSTTFGTLTVTPIEKVTVYITGKTSTVNYNGREQSVSGYSVSFSNQLYTENDFKFKGTAEALGTAAGTYPMGLTAAMFENKSTGTFSNVTFVVTDGSLTINKASLKLVITADSASKKYDGTALTVSTFTYNEAALLGGDTVAATVTGTVTNAGSADNTVTAYKVSSKEGDDRTACYNIETVAGKLTVTKREITFTSASDTKKFNGSPLTNNTVVVGLDGFAGAEGADFSVTGSQTYVGSSKNSFTYTLKDGAVEGNYSIKKVEGTLTVTPSTEKPVITLEPNANSADLTYNGKKQTVDGFKQTVFTVEGHTYTVSGVTATASGTAAGTYDISVNGTAVVRDENGVDVTENFTVSINSGILTIKKYAITASSANLSKEFDGKALTDTGAVSCDALVDGDTIAFTHTGSQKYVGESDNSFTYEITSPNGNDNYEVTTEFGKLTVTDRTVPYGIDISSAAGEFTYDALVHSVSGLKAVWSGVPTPKFAMLTKASAAASETLTVVVDGCTYTITGLSASVAQKNAGRYENTITGEGTVLDSDGVDVTKQFSLNKVNGTLVINKRSITLTSDSATKEYDGTELTKHGVTVSEDGFAAGEGATYTFTGSITEVGSVENYFEYSFNEGTLKDNYKLTKEEGLLKVTPYSGKVTVTVTEHSGTFFYDGTEKTVSGYDFSANHPLYKEEYAVFTGSSAVYGTVAGVYNMEIKASDFANNSGLFSNVEFVIVDGTLTIKQSGDAIVIKIKAEDPVYDGKPHSGEIEVENLPDGYTVTKKEITKTVTDVDDGTLKIDESIIDIVITDKNGNDVTDKLNLVYEEKTIKVVPAELKITTEGAEKVYDGTPLTASGKVEGLVGDETVKVEFTGSQTVGGESDNTYTVTWNGTAKEHNYTIVPTVGKLKVTYSADTIIVTVANEEKVYNGKLQKPSITVSKLPAGLTLSTVDTSYGATHVSEGKVVCVCDTLVIVNNAGEDVTSSLTIAYEAGSMTITPATLVVTTESATKVHDGTALTNDQNAKVEGFANGETAKMTVVGSQTEVGSSANEYHLSFIVEGETLCYPTDYVIEEHLGTLTVTEEEPVPETSDDSFFRIAVAAAVAVISAAALTIFVKKKKEDLI